MKFIIAAAAAAIAVSSFLNDPANAKDVTSIWTTISESAPRSVFDDLRDSAPRSIFDEIRDSAPLAPVFETLRDNAP